MIKRIRIYTGWLATVLGWIQWISAVPVIYLSYIQQTGTVVELVELGLLAIGMSLILLLIGYMFRHPLEQWMKWLFVPVLLYAIATIRRIVVVDAVGWGLPDKPFHMVEGFVSMAQVISGWPLWLVFLIILYFSSGFQVGDKSNPLSTRTGQYRFAWLGIVVFLVLTVMTLAGNPLVFIDPASFLAVILPLPFLLVLSGMSFSQLIPFAGGIFSLKFVDKKQLEPFQYYARKAGSISVLLGALTSLIGFVVLLGNLDSPDRLGPTLAISLLSLFYGLGLKILVFDPYKSTLHRIHEEMSSDD